MSLSHIFNKPAVATPYFTPAQNPAPGVVHQDDSNRPVPKLFTPLKIRDVTFHNRIFLPPLCQYSDDDGHMTLWHMAHIGGMITRGPGLSFIEATAIAPEGRISPQDVGIWDDTHVKGLKQLVDFAHSQNQKIGIQLAHAGCKASTVVPWLHRNYPATEVAGGFTGIVGPSPIPYSSINQVPIELSKSGINDIVQAWAQAARRAVAAGFNVIEIHGAHGFLLHSFMSPVSNHRMDEYGGSFENRIRLTLEVVDAVRGVIPDGMPLFFRVSASDRMEELDEPSWKLEDTIKLAPLLASRGVDLIDVSSTGTSPKQSPQDTQAHQKFSAAIKKAISDIMLVSTVGGINSGVQAEGYLQNGIADLVFVGRHFLKHPGMVWSFAEELGVKVRLVRQIEWALYEFGSARKFLSEQK